MDLNQTPTSSKKPRSVEDVFEDFDFKPITAGLGFQTGNKGEEAIQKANLQVAQRATPARSVPVTEHPFSAHHRSANAAAPANDYVQSDLSLFYAKPNETMASTMDFPETKSVEVATLGLRAIAFLVDMMIVGGMTWITFALVSYLTDIDFAASLMEGHSDMMIVVGVMFAGYFTLYFTILEKFQGSSLGKEALGLQVETLDGYGPSLLRALARTLITLVGVLSLGLTAWVDLAGKMTTTRVVRA